MTDIATTSVSTRKVHAGECLRAIVEEHHPLAA
jgi:hypothetical protein